MADVFDAWTMNRCNEITGSLEEAVRPIDEARGHPFDPVVVGALIGGVDTIVDIRGELSD